MGVLFQLGIGFCNPKGFFSLLHAHCVGCKGCSQNAAFQDIVMGISKTEVNLKRLLAAAPQQKKQAKLVHYVATLREQLEQLAQERTSEGLPRVSKAVVNDFSEKIEAIASKLAAPLTTPDTQVSQEPLEETAINESPSKTGENHILPTPRLRRRFVPSSNGEDRIHDTAEADLSAPVKLGAAAQAHIEKHRLGSNDSSHEVSDSNFEILDSTEQAVEHSLASTGRANVRAVKIYSESSKTTCFTWLAIFAMTCIFIMVVLLIRVT